jgi:hypothetical protein
MVFFVISIRGVGKRLVIGRSPGGLSGFRIPWSGTDPAPRVRWTPSALAVSALRLGPAAFIPVIGRTREPLLAMPAHSTAMSVSTHTAARPARMPVSTPMAFIVAIRVHPEPPCAAHPGSLGREHTTNPAGESSEKYNRPSFRKSLNFSPLPISPFD